MYFHKNNNKKQEQNTRVSAVWTAGVFYKPPNLDLDMDRDLIKV